MASYIGLKLANGQFYPILAENAPQKKRLVLTTVTDDQTGVQIDLYRAPDKSMKAARYVGTLVVEDIRPQKKGEPSIEMIIEYGADGDILAQAVDLARRDGGRQQLSVSLKALSEPPESHAPPAEPDERRGVDTRPRKAFPMRAVLLAVLALAVLGAAAFAARTFLPGGAFLGKAPAPAETAAPPPVYRAPDSPPPAETADAAQPVYRAPAATPPPPETAAAAPAGMEAPPAPPSPASASRAAARARSMPPVASYNVPSPIPPQGVWYTVRWGDTLWAISEAFYRDPWRYRFIARSNGIHDPSYIISGDRIRIPPRP